MGNVIDLTGKRFGRLRVLERNGRAKSGHIMWRCKCDCGKENTIRGYHLVQKRIRSCGCLVDESRRKKKHGMVGTPEYISWYAMKTRCNNPNAKDFECWGGRGIGYCESWEKFESFYRDMGKRNDGFVLERVNNNKGYGPDNCKWATHKEQANNRRPRRGR